MGGKVRGVKLALSVASIFILSACHTPPLKGSWRKDGFSVDDFHSDAEVCRSKARTGFTVDPALFSFCMEEKGWHYVKLPSNGPSDNRNHLP